MSFSLVINDAQAADEAPGTATETAAVPPELSAEKMMTDNLVILAALFSIFYFILIRPQQKRVKTHQAMLKELQKGQKVITSGGMIGTIAKFEGEDVVVVEVAQGVKVRFSRSSISEVVTGAGASGESANDN